MQARFLILLETPFDLGNQGLTREPASHWEI